MSYIRSSVANGVGEIVLDRPKARNALDQSMVDEMYEVLLAWGDDQSVETVLVTSASEKAFCAGGDIRAIRDHVLAGDTDAVRHYFESEYRLDQLIAEYPKAYVALIDGAVMGGGLGISVHGEIRIVTEHAVAAMPETAIGFFPDVGSSYFLPRLPAGVGMWLGLTGARVVGADIVALGLATHCVHSAQLCDVATAIRAGVPLAQALDGRLQPIDWEIESATKAAQYFNDSNVVAIVGGLRGAVGDGWAEQAVSSIEKASPTSLLVTAGLIEAGSAAMLDACLERELYSAERITAQPDFAEGVRAVLVDKDRNPRFNPPAIDQVDPEVIAGILGAQR